MCACDTLFNISLHETPNVVIQNEQGVHYARNIADLKHALASSVLDEKMSTAVKDAEEETSTPTADEPTISDDVRPKRMIRKPDRLKNMFLYHIYQ